MIVTECFKRAVHQGITKTTYQKKMDVPDLEFLGVR